MSVFGWVSDFPEPPPQWDLRRRGWTLASAAGRVCLVDGRNPGTAMSSHTDRQYCLYLGIASGHERARLLAAGAGDVLPPDIALPELEQRACRVRAARERLPRHLKAGPLTLDLIHRDAFAGERWLALHPREFELLWRLAERPGERVSRTRLLREVWRLEFEPGTNSVEVHVSRLRARLASAGIYGLVVTEPEGGYRLVEPGDKVVDPQLCA